jgi:hypothetical protein
MRGLDGPNISQVKGYGRRVSNAHDGRPKRGMSPGEGATGRAN